MAHLRVPPPSRSAVSRLEHPERGTPSSPPGMGVPFHSLKENSMFAVPKTRKLPAVGVLLGGSGRARVPTLQMPPVAALMRPFALASMQVCEASENRAVGNGSC
jgi:hypothetical protein